MSKCGNTAEENLSFLLKSEGRSILDVSAQFMVNERNEIGFDNGKTALDCARTLYAQTGVSRCNR